MPVLPTAGAGSGGRYDTAMNSKDDQIIRNAEKCDDEGISPMDPPEATNPPSDIKALPREELAPFIRDLWDEHETFTAELDAFEATLESIRKDGIGPEVNGRLSDFFRYFAEELVLHHRKEERHLFPVLESKLIESGECGTGPERHTAVNVMEEDHLLAVQTAAVVFNFFGMASRLADEESRKAVLETALAQGDELIEQMRTHIFRENSILFPLAHRLIDASILSSMGSTEDPATPAGLQTPS